MFFLKHGVHQQAQLVLDYFAPEFC